MYNPLEDPIPDDPIQRVHALARDLAYGVVKGFWSAEILVTFSRGGEIWRVLPHNESVSLSEKWEAQYPFVSIFVSFGYLQISRVDEFSKRYLLTPKTFELLERPTPTSIFVSYSRSESSAFALLLLARFKELGLEPFLDMSIEPGDDWHAHLYDQVVERENFVILIGPSTLESRWVRQEIKWALESGAQIIPIWHNRFDDARLSDIQKQYPDLGEFYKKQAIKVENENAVAYEGAITQLLNRFGVTP